MRFVVSPAVALFFALPSMGPIVTPTLAQDVGIRPASGRQGASVSGRDLYLSSCANCHGADGTGAQALVVGLPVQPPDFTES